MHSIPLPGPVFHENVIMVAAVAQEKITMRHVCAWCGWQLGGGGEWDVWRTVGEWDGGGDDQPERGTKSQKP